MYPRLALLVICLTAPLTVGAADQKKKDSANSGTSKSARNLAVLEKEFAETMSGAVLVGSFTVDGQDKPPQKERYTITKAVKLHGNTWLFNARIQYGNHDVTVPLPLLVEWAGDTPVITLTDVSIPGLGTFTSRVLVYRGRYAGTWQHGKVGGQLFGKIERAPAETTSNSTNEKKD